MQRRKTIKKIAIVATILLLISLIGWSLQFPYRENQNEERMQKLEERISAVAQKAKAQLLEIDNLILKLPVDESLITNLQSKFMEIHRKGEEPKPFLWMNSDTTADHLKFQFGVPTQVFEKLNTAWIYNRSKYIENRIFNTRHEFLSKLISQQGDVTSPEFEGTTFSHYSNMHSECIKLPVMTYSRIVTGLNNKVLGTLYIQLDDSANKNLFLSRYYFEQNDLFSKMNPIFSILGGIALVFLWGLLPTWVYIDAKERGEKNAGIWTVLTLISLFFGLTFYWILRPAELRSQKCPNCNEDLKGSKSFCHHCGISLDDTICQECQSTIKPKWNYCPNCRSSLRSE